MNNGLCRRCGKITDVICGECDICRFDHDSSFMRTMAPWEKVEVETVDNIEILKPCPFCGENAAFIEREYSIYQIGCRTDFCFCNIKNRNGMCISKEISIERWNTRKKVVD